MLYDVFSFILYHYFTVSTLIIELFQCNFRNRAKKSSGFFTIHHKNFLFYFISYETTKTKMEKALRHIRLIGTIKCDKATTSVNYRLSLRVVSQNKGFWFFHFLVGVEAKTTKTKMARKFFVGGNWKCVCSCLPFTIFTILLSCEFV